MAEDAAGAVRRTPNPARDDHAEIIVPVAQPGQGATNPGGLVSRDAENGTGDLRAKLAGLIDINLPEDATGIESTDIEAAAEAILAAGWRPPLPGDVVRDFCAERAGFITAINNCHPDNDRDYWRWQGHAESRRQLSERLGLPTAWPAEVRP